MYSNDISRVRQLRKEIFLTAYAGHAGHLASAFSIIEVLYVLYFKNIMKYDAVKPEWKYRDRLILSKGHASLALYVILAEAGFFKKEELMTFSRPGSRIGGEPRLGDIPGIEASTGSLGHGLAYGLGIAMAMKMDNSGSQVYVILGDGECQEGTVWESVIAANQFKLNNLTVILDSNKLQAMDSIEHIMGIDEWRSKWEAFGWIVDRVDGHDIRALTECLRLNNASESPRLIIADTVKGKGVSFMENAPIWHYRMPNERELAVVMKELGIAEEELEKCVTLI